VIAVLNCWIYDLYSRLLLDVLMALCFLFSQFASLKANEENPGVNYIETVGAIHRSTKDEGRE
jgi:hypothetical protein